MEAYLNDLKQRGVRDVILTWQEEYGQVPEQTAVNYQQLHLAQLLAYDAGEILKWSCGECTAADRARIADQVQAAGLPCMNAAAISMISAPEHANAASLPREVRCPASRPRRQRRSSPSSWRSGSAGDLSGHGPGLWLDTQIAVVCPGRTRHGPSCLGRRRNCPTICWVRDLTISAFLQLLRDQYQITGICVGADFRGGKNRHADAQDVRALPQPWA